MTCFCLNVVQAGRLIKRIRWKLNVDWEKYYDVCLHRISTCLLFPDGVSTMLRIIRYVHYTDRTKVRRQNISKEMIIALNKSPKDVRRKVRVVHMQEGPLNIQSYIYDLRACCGIRWNISIWYFYTVWDSDVSPRVTITCERLTILNHLWKWKSG